MKIIVEDIGLQEGLVVSVGISSPAETRGNLMAREFSANADKFN